MSLTLSKIHRRNQRQSWTQPRLQIGCCLILLASLLLSPCTVYAEITTTLDTPTANEASLTIRSDADDAIRLTCEGGLLKLNSADLSMGEIGCDQLRTLVVEGGNGPNWIDLNAITVEDFPNLSETTINGGRGNDVITGTAMIDTIDGGPDNDTIASGKGDDLMLGGSGHDHLLWRNGDATDAVEGGDGFDEFHVIGAQGKADAYEIAADVDHILFQQVKPTPLTIGIGGTERIRIYNGDPEDSLKSTRLPSTQVQMDSVEPILPVAQETPNPIVLTAAGSISNTIEAYKLLLGGINNGGEPTSYPTGYRTINWDGVPDSLAAPNFFEPDFFNASTSPRARGITFLTAGDGLMVSANAQNPDGVPVRFGNINPSYVDSFQAFSPERLFSPIGSNLVDATFYLPGTTTPAAVRGFGAVYTDIDTDHTAFEYFDIDGNSLGSYQAPITKQGLSFLGVLFDAPIIHRVRIRYGTDALGPDDGSAKPAPEPDGVVDVAVMDDFFYGEPQPIASEETVTGEATDEKSPTISSGLVAKFATLEENRLASLSVDLSQIEPLEKGKRYAIWLVDDAGNYTLAGGAQNGEIFTYTHSAGTNLVGFVSGIVISSEAADDMAANRIKQPTTTIYQGQIPSTIRQDLRMLVVNAPDTPESMPYDPGLRLQAKLAADHAQLALNVIKTGNLGGGRLHAEHVWNILLGKEDDRYGDINEDGTAQNPGDGYGVNSYARAVIVIADRIAETGELDAVRHNAAVNMGLCARTIADTWLPDAVEQIVSLTQAIRQAEAETAATTLVETLQAMSGGVDADGDGAIEFVAGECGAEQTYAQSHSLFDMSLVGE